MRGRTWYVPPFLVDVRGYDKISVGTPGEHEGIERSNIGIPICSTSIGR